MSCWPESWPSWAKIITCKSYLESQDIQNQLRSHSQLLKGISSPPYRWWKTGTESRIRTEFFSPEASIKDHLQEITVTSERGANSIQEALDLHKSYLNF